MRVKERVAFPLKHGALYTISTKGSHHGRHAFPSDETTSHSPKLLPNTTKQHSCAYKNFTFPSSFLLPWCLVDLHGTASFADGVILVDRARRCSRDAHQIDHPSVPALVLVVCILVRGAESAARLVGGVDSFPWMEERRMGCRRSVRHYILVPSVPTRSRKRTSCHYVTLTVWSNHDAHTPYCSRLQSKINCTVHVKNKYHNFMLGFPSSSSSLPTSKTTSSRSRPFLWNRHCLLHVSHPHS